MSDERIPGLIALVDVQQTVLLELLHSHNKRAQILKVLVDRLGASDPAIRAALIDAAGSIQELEHAFRLVKPQPHP